jgi:methyl-accepting chemotaxis protein
MSRAGQAQHDATPLLACLAPINETSAVHLKVNEISLERCRLAAEWRKTVQELDRTTQQNAALVEQTTSAAPALNHQAIVLQDEIANFKVA